MADSHLQFDNRLRKLSRKHQAMSRGYTTRMRSDGLIIAVPQRQRSRIPPQAIFLFFAAIIGFKAFLIASLGPVTYSDRVLRLQDGTWVEKAGAFVMQIDPASEWVATKIGPIFRK